MQSVSTRGRRVAVIVAVLATVVALAGGLLVARAAPWDAGPDTRWRSLGMPLGAVERMSWVTGSRSPARTDERWNVVGTDLGHPIEHDGDLYLMFGDTWGADGTEGSDWRSNGLARAASPDPRDGLVIDEMITDDSGQAAELLPSQKVDGVEKTVIPTYGISVGGDLVVHYMSVRRWTSDGRWEVEHAGFATSGDDGERWTVHDPSLDGDGGYAQVAMVEVDGWVLVYGIPSGRFGSVRLARSRPGTLIDPATWQHWTGTDWADDSDGGTVLVDGPVGELSVRWNAHLGRWVMLTLDESVGAIMLRTAPQPTGPWTLPILVTAAEQFPQLYAPYIVPGSDTGDDLYFTMSQFGPYQVSLMKLRLSSLGLGPADVGASSDVAA